MSAEIVEKIRASGWRQCMALPRAAHDQLRTALTIDVPDEALCVVISHSCDILQKSLEAEPDVEIIVGLPITKLDGNFTSGKNPRRLHASTRAGDGSAYEFQISRRHRLPRSVLANFAPDSVQHISPECATELINWVVLRYRRQAFPDEFQRRVSPHLRALKEKAKPMTSIAALHIGLHTWEELDEQTEYEVVLLGLIDSEVAADPLKVQQAQDAFYAFEKAMASIPGLFVNVDLNRVASEEEVSVAELKVLPKWTDFDTVSIVDQENHVMETRPMLRVVR